MLSVGILSRNKRGNFVKKKDVSFHAPEHSASRQFIKNNNYKG